MPDPCPRIALLTWCSPSSHYAGGAAIRRLLSRMPADHVRWCGFHAQTEPAPALPPYRAFPPRALHWRLNGAAIEHWSVELLHARRLAARMWEWLASFQPQILWVVPEMWAVPVGAALAGLSGLPVHATVHDAPESAGIAGLPVGYRRRYIRTLRRFLHGANSVDAVTEALLAHLAEGGALAARARTLVIPPSIGPADVRQPPPAAPGTDEIVVGLCGSFRIAPTQWRGFLEALGRLSRPVRLLAFVRADEVPAAALPPNVTLDVQPYAETESAVIESLASANVWACYLGVWRDPSRRLFGRTSLSSKLVTYAAAARPILVDAEADAAAWQLVNAHGAGLRLDGAPADVANVLRSLLADGDAWRRMAEGAQALCRERFDLDRNAERLKEALAGCVGGSTEVGDRKSGVG